MKAAEFSIRDQFLCTASVCPLSIKRYSEEAFPDFCFGPIMPVAPRGDAIADDEIARITSNIKMSITTMTISKAMIAFALPCIIATCDFVHFCGRGRC